MTMNALRASFWLGGQQPFLAKPDAPGKSCGFGAAAQ